jgi:hypothetical protein
MNANWCTWITLPVLLKCATFNSSRNRNFLLHFFINKTYHIAMCIEKSFEWSCLVKFHIFFLFVFLASYLLISCDIVVWLWKRHMISCQNKMWLIMMMHTGTERNKVGRKMSFAFQVSQNSLHIISSGFENNWNEKKKYITHFLRVRNSLLIWSCFCTF